MKSSLILQTSYFIRKMVIFFQETHKELCIKIYNTRHVTSDLMTRCPRFGIDLVVERDLLAQGTCSGVELP